MPKEHRRIVFVWALCACFASTAFTQCPLPVSGQWGGITTRAEYSNGTLFAAVGPNLVAIDVSDQTHPRRVGQLSFDRVNFTMGDSHAYVIRDDGLHVIDVSVPASMHEVASLISRNDDETPADQPMYWDHHLYVHSRTLGHLIFDVTDPTRPRLAGRLDEDRGVQIKTIVDGRAYARVDETLMQIWDMSIPAQPRLLGEFDTGESVYAVAVHGGFAYLSYFGPVQIWDVRDPQQPVHVGQTEPDDRAWSLVAYDGILASYGTAPIVSNSLKIYSLAEPAEPAFLAEIPSSHYGSALSAGADALFLSGFEGSLGIVNISLPNIPRLTSVYHDSATLENEFVALHGDFAFVGCGRTVRILSLRHDAPPELATVIELAPRRVADWLVVDWVSRLYTADGYLFLTTTFEDRIYDITSPAQPALLATRPAWSTPRLVAGRMYRFTDDHMMEVFDAANPLEPHLLGQTKLSGRGVTLKIADQRAYVIVQNDDGRNVDIVDVIDPTAPLRRGTINPHDRYILDFAAFGSQFYLVDAGSHLVRFDISDPEHPQGRTIYNVPPWISAIEFHDGLAHIAYAGGLLVADVSDPLAVRHRFTHPGPMHGVVPGDGFTLAFHQNRGLTVVPQMRDGDSDGDQDVDLADLTRLLSHFGEEVDSGYAAGDFECNGSVGLGDLAILLAAFGTSH